MFRSWSESLAADQMNHDSFFHSEALRLVDRESISRHERELSPSHSGAFLACGHRQDGNPLGFALIECWSAVVKKLTNKHLWEGAHATRAIDGADEFSTRSISQAKLVRDVPVENRLAASYEIDHAAQAAKCRR